ncbi:hypothetical protein IMW82_03515 [Rhodanobacter sp. B2A1Ga4]|uniref:hypothetical protein n=1 Tax=Rhodanobacter sp. B2A1Ga4 TaxID=2778647 RepID=UPI001B37D1D3|nr:hypothetical protein [Rhodanobacter sp. B2A1Ga4]MBQ4853748.1 hypothetical protein [Rhodanobacter sp. B2A1Ga4]
MTLAQLQDEIEKARQEDIEAMKAKAVEEERSLFFNQPHAVADLSYWGKMALWTLEEAIALSLGKSPNVVNWSAVNGDGDSHIRVSLRDSPFRREYARRRQLTSRAAAAYELSDPIKPEAFLSWSLNTFDSVPAELIEQVRAMGKRIADLHVLTERVAELEAQLSATGAVTRDRWPWGSHETELLRKLESAATRFWVRYDPTQPSSANTNATVTDWLKGEGVSSRVAEIMAQILRADGLPTGPRA